MKYERKEKIVNKYWIFSHNKGENDKSIDLNPKSNVVGGQVNKSKK